MSGTTTVTVGDRGRVVLPAQTRERLALVPGSTMVLLEAPGAVLLMTQEELLSRVRADFAGAGLVEKLLAERRQASAAEDAGSPPVTAGAAA